MNCKDLEELLSAYADGELSRTQREFIEEHLSGCADCRETLAEFEAAGRQLSSLRETPVESDIRTATLSKIRAAGALTDKPYRRWLRPALAITVVVAVIAAPILVRLWSADLPPGGTGIMSPPPLNEYIKGYTYTLALLAGVLMMVGLAFRSRFARRIAGFMSIVFGGIGVYLGLDALLSVTKSDQSLIMGIIPFFGLIAGIVSIKRQAGRHWEAAAGLTLCLGALVLYVIFLVGYHHWFSWLFLAATIALPTGIIVWAFHHEIKRLSWQQLRPVTAAAAIVAVIAIMLATQPWGMESPEAMAASIVRNSTEVQMALNGEEIEEVEVTTKVVDEGNNVLMMLVRTEERTVAAEVNLDTKQVTEIIRVDVPDFQPGDEQKAIDIAKADPRIQEILAQGGKISKVHLLRHIDIAEVTSPDGIVRKEGTVILTALLTIEQDKYDWNILINLQKSEVASIGRSQPSATMTVVDISRFLTRFVAPVLLFLGILLVSGLSFSYRRAKTIAGTASLALGIIGLFMALYSLSSIWWRQVLSVGIPAVGLVIGITGIRQRLGKRWLPITGIVLSSLALLLILMNAIMLNINSVPGENIVRVIGIAVVIAGIIAYAFKEQIMSIHVSGKWLRPAAVALAAVVVLIVALVQPWSVNPEGVIARAYSATEGLLSYRATMSGTASEGGNLNSTIEFVFPDRFRVRLASGGGTDEFIVIGDKQYVKSGDMSRNTIIAFSNSASSMLNKEATLKLIDSLTDLETLPDENIEGVNSFHYKGRFDTARMIEKEKARLSGMQSRMDEDDYERMMEGLENSLNINMEIELWIGKDDNLIRQMVQTTHYPDDEGKLQTTSTMMTFYDFNEPIIIEPPLDANGELLEGWQLAGSITPGATQPVFNRNFTSSIGVQEGYDDYAHQEVEYSITITNNSIETVKDVRITIATMLTDAAVKSAKVEAEPEMPADTIAPGESRTYHARCPFDATGLTKEEIIKVHDMATILVHFTTEDGRELTELLYPDAPYPTKTPPAVPPEQDVTKNSE